MASVSQREILERFHDAIPVSRGLGDSPVQPPVSPATNAVEAALNLARKAVARDTILSFADGFHAMTPAALAATGNVSGRPGHAFRARRAAFDRRRATKTPDPSSNALKAMPPRVIGEDALRDGLARLAGSGEAVKTADGAAPADPERFSAA